jgi:hypothetical protein
MAQGGTLIGRDPHVYAGTSIAQRRRMQQLRLLALAIPLLVIACAPPSDDAEATRASTFAFTADEATAFREPTNAPCGVNDTPYENVDTFDLRLTDKDANAKVSAIAFRFRATSTGIATLDAHGMRASDGDAMLLQVGVPAGAPEKPLANAKVVIGAPPAKDGDALSVHLIVEFADGDFLNESISTPVKSAFGSCPTGK